jgi:hypothetical protein
VSSVVPAVSILDPFSNSMEFLLYSITPGFNQKGSSSYIILIRLRRSFAELALLDAIPMNLSELKIAYQRAKAPTVVEL